MRRSWPRERAWRWCHTLITDVKVKRPKRPKADDYDYETEINTVGSYSFDRKENRKIKDKKIVGFVRPKKK